MTATKTREAFPDILRGFALLGIALVNVPFLTISTAEGVSGADLSNPIDSATAFTVATLAQAKFYLIFSFLFGYSARFIIGDDRTRRRRWVMRAIGLMLLGLAHGILLFHGDILFTYGLIALLLLAFYFRAQRTVAVWMWIVYGLSLLLMSGLALLTVIGEQLLGPDALGDLGIPATLDTALTSGTFTETIAARIELLGFVLPQVLFVQGQMVLVGFLAGLIASRRHVFERTPDNAARMKKIAVWGFAIGLPLQALAAWILVSNEIADVYSYGLALVAFAINTYAAPPLSAALVAGLWLLTGRTTGKTSLFASAGRMALTMYLGQSLITTLLFSSWGLGLFGTMGVLEVTLVAIGVWCALALTANLLLQRYRSGPMEYILKRFSLLGSKKATK